MELLELTFEVVNTESLQLILSEPEKSGCLFIIDEKLCAIDLAELRLSLGSFLSADGGDHWFRNIKQFSFDYFLFNEVTIQFIKYDNQVDLNILFEMDLECEIFNYDVENFVKKMAQHLMIKLGAKFCYFGMEPATDVATQIFSLINHRVDIDVN